jgi:2-oxoisovalerate dehydrogenase E1 component
MQNGAKLKDKVSDHLNNGKVINSVNTNGFKELTKDNLLQVLKLMITSRTMDVKIMNMLKQGKSYFHLPSAGHEATQIAFGMEMKKGVDWAYPYYRDMAFMLGLGTKMEDIFLHQLAKEDDPMTGGRQMSCHWASKEFNVPTQSSPTGTQFLQAVGTALACKKSGLKSVAYVSGGEGTTSEGEFHEAVNWASREKIPVIFVIQNNKWAISVPVENQTAGKNASVSEMMSGYENLLRFSVDGTDFFTMHQTAQKAFEYARNGNGPVLVEAKTIRLFSHSTSDDQAKYRSKESLAEDLKNDPLNKFSETLFNDGILTKEFYEEIKKEITEHVNNAADWAYSKPEPDVKNVKRFVFDESGKKK